MAEVIPFRGLRYAKSAGDLSKLIAPPYDIIPAALRDELYEASPHNVIRVEFGRDEPSRDKYADARDALDRWTREGVLERDEQPAFYLTEHWFDGKRAVRRGLLGALRVYPEGSDQVLPHERTIPKDRADRLNLIRETATNTSPIFGMVDDTDGRLKQLLVQGMSHQRVVADATVNDERHLIWRLDDPAGVRALTDFFAKRRVYLADGHHRYEVAREYLAEERAAGRRTAPDDPAAFVLAFLCSLTDDGLRVFSTHRVISGAAQVVDAAIARSFDAKPASRPEGLSLGIVREGKIQELTPRASIDRTALPEVLHGLPVADAELLIAEPARHAGATVTFTSNAKEAVGAARGDTVSVLVGGIDGPTIKRVADAGERMPIKSTYFYPKVPAGLVLRPLDESGERSGRDSNPRSRKPGSEV